MFGKIAAKLPKSLTALRSRAMTTKISRWLERVGLSTLNQGPNMTPHGMIAAHAVDRTHPIDPQVRQRILDSLDAIAAQHDVRVLFACESGSRGWGFASPDSDYDVRFIYVHRPEWYLRVLPGRDVIELPIDDVLDVGGWDLRKTLGLIRKGNAVPAEWLDSPVVYRQYAAFAKQLREALQATCQPQHVFHHYLHMAQTQWSRSRSRQRVRLKNYFYVLRPLLAALWIERESTWPPMPFHELFDALVTDPSVREAVDVLLEYKRSAGEAREGEPVPAIDDWVEVQLQRLVAHRPVVAAPDFGVLDRLLFDTVMGRVC